MKVAVRGFAEFRELLGEEFSVSVQVGESVGGLLEALESTNPAFQSRIRQSDGNLMPAIIILLNGRSIHSLRGLESGLTEGDVVAIFSPIAGG